MLGFICALSIEVEGIVNLMENKEETTIAKHSGGGAAPGRRAFGRPQRRVALPARLYPAPPGLDLRCPAILRHRLRHGSCQC